MTLFGVLIRLVGCLSNGYLLFMLLCWFEFVTKKVMMRLNLMMEEEVKRWSLNLVMKIIIRGRLSQLG